MATSAMLLYLTGEFHEAHWLKPSIHTFIPGTYRRTSNGHAACVCPGCDQYIVVGSNHHIPLNGVVDMVECPRCGWWGRIGLLAWASTRTR